jgi:methylenetetrahydrofolate dehydrogenase (NADP+) / methenyltetrahydrofolate cyclohydrolase
VKATVYDGKVLVSRLSARIKRETERLKRQHHIEAGLGILMVTGDQVSMSDASKVASTAEEVGIKVYLERVAQRNIARKFFPTLDEYAKSPFIQGIYIQLPLPTEIISLDEVMRRLPVSKDVGGIHFLNRGMATYPAREAGEAIISPEILAIASTLKECKIELRGGKLVVVGGGTTEGMVQLLAGYFYNKGCNVRLIRYENIHSQVEEDGLRHLRPSDVPGSGSLEIINPDGEAVVSWANQPGWLTRARLHPASVVIDMGYKFARGRVSGDCDFMSILENGGIVTPVPGGVRNIVRYMILQNMVQLIKKQIGEDQERATGVLRRRFASTQNENQTSLKRFKAK